MHTALSAGIVTSPRISHGDFTPLLHTHRRVLARLPLKTLRYTKNAIGLRHCDVGTSGQLLSRHHGLWTLIIQVTDLGIVSKAPHISCYFTNSMFQP